MIKNFLNRIQNSDESTKKFWLIIFSGLSMLIVVSGWMLYIDKTVANVDEPAGSQPLAVAEKKEIASEAPGFFAIFGAGVKTIFDALKEKLAVKNNIVIENQERNFIAEEVKEIAPTKLP